MKRFSGLEEDFGFNYIFPMSDVSDKGSGLNIEIKSVIIETVRNIENVERKDGQLRQ